MALTPAREGPGVVILGGSANALSIGRSLGRQGVDVALSQVRGRPESRSRWFSETHPFDSPAAAPDFWRDLLTGERLTGRLLLGCDDDAVDFLARNRAQLEERGYILDESRPELQLALLDKRQTLDLARAAGIPAPRTWNVDAADDGSRALEEIEYPVIVKPVHSHLFQRHFGVRGRKYFAAADRDALRRVLTVAARTGLDVIVTEKIPGPDSLLASYYTYVTPDGSRLFRYTKRVVRRYPRDEGLGSCHVAEWDEEVAALGERFFAGIGFQGFGNVEFKRDPRDGKLKIIECNPRFTAAQELLFRCGVDTAWIVYSHLAGFEVPRVESYRQGLMLLWPLRDLRAFIELRRAGDITFVRWIDSLLQPKVLPYFSPSDPLPVLDATLGKAARTAWRLFRADGVSGELPSRR